MQHALRVSDAARAPVPVLGTVLCAVDTSPSAAAVLYTAAGLAAHPDSRLVVLRVGDDSDEALVELNHLAQRAIPGWLSYRQETDVVVRTGRPAMAIVDVARERGANLIVMGTHGRSTLSRLMWGSVTASVLRHTTVPVAVVPPSGPELISLTNRHAVPHLGSVLVPVDLRGGSPRQLAVASMLSLATERELTLLHAIPAQADSGEPLRKLKELAARIDAHAGVVSVVTHGPLVSVIVDRQLRCGAGVVVLGRDNGSPGRVARALLEKTRAVVVFVP